MEEFPENTPNVLGPIHVTDTFTDRVSGPELWRLMTDVQSSKRVKVEIGKDDDKPKDKDWMVIEILDVQDIKWWWLIRIRYTKRLIVEGKNYKDYLNKSRSLLYYSPFKLIT